MAGRLLVAGALVACTLLVGLSPVHNPDIGLHLATGAHVAAHGPPHMDPFSFTTEGKPWVAFEWGSGLLLHGVHAAAGWNGLIALKLLLVLLTLLALVSIGRREGAAPAVVALALVLLLPTVSDRVTVRPHLFGYLLLACTMAGAMRLRSGDRRWLLGLPALAALWVNLHGSFVLAPVVVGLGALRKGGLRDAVAAAVLTGLATLANPYGWAAWWVPFAHLGEPTFRQAITEWGPAAEGELSPTVLAHWAWLALGLSSFALGGRWREVHRSGPFALLALLSLGAIRFVAPFLLMTAPLVAANLRLPRRWALGALLPALAVAPLVAAAVPGWAEHGLGRDPGEAPAGAAAHIREAGLRGLLFNPFDDGDYLIGELYPEVRVFIDGRLDLHGPEALRRYVGPLLHDPAAFDAEARHRGIDLALTKYREPTYAPLAAHLDRSPDWGLIWVDARHALHGRGAAGYRTLRASPDPGWALDVEPATLEPEVDALLGHPASAPLGRWLRGFVRYHRAGLPSAVGVHPDLPPTARDGVAAALPDLSAAAAALPRVPAVLLHHGLALAHTGDLAGARRALEALLAVHPETPEAMVALLEIRLIAGDSAALAEASALLTATAGSANPWLLHLRRLLEARP